MVRKKKMYYKKNYELCYKKCVTIITISLHCGIVINFYHFWYHLVQVTNVLSADLWCQEFLRSFVFYPAILADLRAYMNYKGTPWVIPMETFSLRSGDSAGVFHQLIFFLSKNLAMCFGSLSTWSRCRQGKKSFKKWYQGFLKNFAVSIVKKCMYINKLSNPKTA